MDLEITSSQSVIAPAPGSTGAIAGDVRAVAEMIVLCSLAELEAKRIVRAWSEEWRDEICAVFVDGKVHVYSGVCPHFGGGFCFDAKTESLACEWHGWKFDVHTGVREAGAAGRAHKLRRYRSAIREGNVEVFLK